MTNHALIGIILKHPEFKWIVKDAKSNAEIPIHPNYFPTEDKVGETMFYRFDTIAIGTDEFTVTELDVAKPAKL